jgi:hypothetical protein
MTADECRMMAAKARRYSESSRDAVCKAGWLRTAAEWDERAMLAEVAGRTTAPKRTLELAR